MLTLLAGPALSHEVACDDKAGGLCNRWSRSFVGGPVDSGMPDMVGTVTLDIEIDPDGHVAGCTVQQSSGSPMVDAETCRQLRAYAHYRPALDDAGEPTTGADRLTVEWVFHPREEPPATAPDGSQDFPTTDTVPIDPSNLI